MDTDDLTPMAYEIILEANGILDVMKTEIGALCEKYDTEDSFLKETLEFIEKKIADPESYLDFWNYLDEVELSEFVESLMTLKNSIIKAIGIPVIDRGKPPFK